MARRDRPPPYGLKINYASQGSSFGREQYRGGNIDFAGSDIPFLQAELASTWPRGPQDFVYVPVSAGGLGFMYNVTDTAGQRITSLKLTRAAVCTIFTTPGRPLLGRPHVRQREPWRRSPS